MIVADVGAVFPIAAGLLLASSIFVSDDGSGLWHHEEAVTKKAASRPIDRHLHEGTNGFPE
jgi:hypothetical protein